MTNVLEELVHKKSAKEIEIFLDSLDNESLKGIFLSADENVDELYDLEKSVIYLNSLPKEIRDILTSQSVNLYELLKGIGLDATSKLLYILFNASGKEYLGITSDDVTQILERFFDNPLIFLSNKEDFIKITAILKEIVPEELFNTALLSHTNRQIITTLLINNIKKQGAGLNTVFEFIVNLLLTVNMLTNTIFVDNIKELSDKYEDTFKNLDSDIDKILTTITDLRDNEDITKLDDFDVKEYCNTYHMKNAYTLSNGNFNVSDKFYNTNISIITKIRNALVDDNMEAIGGLLNSISDIMEEVKKYDDPKDFFDKFRNNNSEEEQPKKTTEKKTESVRSKLKRQ